MASRPTVIASDHLPDVLKGAVVALVRRDGADLTSRQIAILLIIYLDPTEAQTVTGLAEQLHVGRPTVSRSLDRLTKLDLVRRSTDPADRRSALMMRTRAGEAFMAMLRKVLSDAAQHTANSVSPSGGG